MTTQPTTHPAQYTPQTVAEAITLLNRPDQRLLPLAGGTYLHHQLQRERNKICDGVVDLKYLALDQIHLHNGWLCIGAMVTLTELAAHETVRTFAGGIVPQTVQHEGPRALCDAATVGGTVALAEADSELYTALLALQAYVTLHSPGWECTVKLAELPAIPPGYLITHVQIKRVEWRGGHARIAENATTRPTVAAVAVVRGALARVALCGVSNRPVLHRGQFNVPPALGARVAQRRALVETVTQHALAAARS